VRRSLLIVEDSDFNRDLRVQIFEGTYDVEVASDGETAVQMASSKRPDLILMDIGLPHLSGVDAVRAIRARALNIHIIAVSSRVMPGDRERAMDAGCDEFVEKPIDDTVLVEMVGGLLAVR
jgi:two-component system cell cycle response regulator DivK